VALTTIHCAVCAEPLTVELRALSEPDAFGVVQVEMQLDEVALAHLREHA
jgi:hypothetical protein